MTRWLMFDSAPPQKVWDLLLLNVNFQQQFPVTLMNVKYVPIDIGTSVEPEWYWLSRCK